MCECTNCICISQVWFNIIFTLNSTLWSEHNPYYGLRTVTVLEDSHCTWGQSVLWYEDSLSTMCLKYVWWDNLIRILFRESLFLDSTFEIHVIGIDCLNLLTWTKTCDMFYITIYFIDKNLVWVDTTKSVYMNGHWKSYDTNIINISIVYS